jgi:hypothetical protein
MVGENCPTLSLNDNAWTCQCYRTYVFEQEVNEGSSNDIPVLGYKLHFRLTAIVHDEWGVIVLIVIAAALEVKLKQKNS